MALSKSANPSTGQIEPGCAPPDRAMIHKADPIPAIPQNSTRNGRTPFPPRRIS